MKTKTFKLPVTWELYGTVEVKAASLEEAIQNFDPVDHEFPSNPQYVDGSFGLTSEDVEEVKVMVDI